MVGVGGDLVVVEAAVAAVALLRDGLAQPRVDMFEELQKENGIELKSFTF